MFTGFVKKADENMKIHPLFKSASSNELMIFKSFIHTFH